MGRTTLLAMLTLFLLASTVGCVGPNKLKRGMDHRLNQSYVNSPVRAQLMFPLNLLLNHIAILGDLLILNPQYFWSDVFRGQGTPYVYEQIEAPPAAAETTEQHVETTSLGPQ